MRVALDLEEVLADTIDEACRSTDNLDHKDFEEWDLNNDVWCIYSGVSDALWRHDPLSIPVVEPALPSKTGVLKGHVDTLDIVTARLHVDDQIRKWLNHHAISYDNIVATAQPKHELGYDVYIDDNPELCGNCRLLLRSHPHNESLDATQFKSCDRVQSFGEAVHFL